MARDVRPDVRDVAKISADAKLVSVSHELATIQRAVEGAALLVDFGRQGGFEGEDDGALAVAILALVSCRLRDLGRAARGSLPVEQFWSPHSAVVDGNDAEDLVLYPAASRTSGRSS